MRKFVLAAFAAAIFFIPAPSSAQQAGGAEPMTDVSSQVSVRGTRDGGVRVKVGHGRVDSRRRDMRRGMRRGRANCVVRKVTTQRGGKTITRTVRRGPGC